jgi:hypothetical protein
LYPTAVVNVSNSYAIPSKWKSTPSPLSDTDRVESNKGRDFIIIASFGQAFRNMVAILRLPK